MNEIAGDAKKFWIPFEEKIMRFMDLIQVAHIFKKYSNYILKKYVKNGYDRIEFRALLWSLKEYDSEGNLIKQY
jgi:hypothetical protein